jgi:hypothetical protein
MSTPAQAPVVTVVYPAAKNGRRVVISEDVPRDEVLKRLANTTAARILHSIPSLAILALDPDVLKTWLSADEWEELKVVAES